MPRALLYDGRTSAARPVSLSLAGPAGAALIQPGSRAQLNDARLVIQDVDSEESVPLAQVRIEERVGKTHRLLQLADARSLEVLDDAQFDELLAAFDPRVARPLLRRLENRWTYALAALVAVAVGSVLFMRFGAPAMAARTVRFIPPGMDAVIGADSLRILDRTTFKPSKLGAERRAQLRAEFAVVSAGLGHGCTCRLEFRAGGTIGANAFALPSGIVVLTDELVDLAKNDDELRGVLAHEVGHVVRRHAMRMLLQSSATALLIGSLFGDVSGVGTLVTAAPAVLVNSAYSRDFEREADQFAFRWMAQHQVDPARFADLLERLAASKGADEQGFLASHPQVRERLRAARLQSFARPPGSS